MKYKFIVLFLLILFFVTSLRGYPVTGAAVLGGGAASGVVGGEAFTATGAILTGQQYSFDPNRAITNAVIGVGSAGVGYKFSKGSQATNQLAQDRYNLVDTSKGQIKVSQHALDRASANKIGISDIQSTIENNKGFSYTYKGQQFTGFYDPKSKIFVPKSKEGVITTVGYRRANYIKNLRAARNRRK